MRGVSENTFDLGLCLWRGVATLEGLGRRRRLLDSWQEGDVAPVLRGVEKKDPSRRDRAIRLL